MNIQQNPEIQTKILHEENSSLYIGDLFPDVNEEDILNIFSKMSGLISVRICRDVISKKSLGYGYINFKDTKHAKRAMKKMNFYFDNDLFKKPLRLMWKEKDSTLRSSGKGNLFVNYLPVNFKTIDLYKLFLPFGKILSCKICFDENGKSKKFGFVHFFSSHDAKEAIKKLNGISLNGTTISICPFMKKEARNFLLPKKSNFTNVYIKNLSIDKFTETNIRNMFEVFGEITSIMIPSEADLPKGFAFVNFASHLDAEEAVFKMDKKKVGDSFLYVSRAETKLERQYILNNTENSKEKLFKQIQKKSFMVIKGIEDNHELASIIFLLLSLGNFSKFKIIQLIRRETFFFVNLSLKKKKRFIVLTKKKHRVIVLKYFNLFKKRSTKPFTPIKLKNLIEEVRSTTLAVRFYKNIKCSKFKEKPINLLISNKLKIEYSKDKFKPDWEKILYFWIKTYKKGYIPALIRLMNRYFKKFTNKFAFVDKKMVMAYEIPIRIW